jgi:hypothetical protein
MFMENLNNMSDIVDKRKDREVVKQASNASSGAVDITVVEGAKQSHEGGRKAS